MKITPVSPVFPINPFSPEMQTTTYEVTEDCVEEVTHTYDSDGALESTQVVTVDVNV